MQPTVTATNALNENNHACNLQKSRHGSSMISLLCHLILSPFRLLRTHLYMIALSIVLYAGWIHRDDNYLSAETGTGYVLGIVGGSLMLILLLYPISKRVALLTRWIPIRYWFGIHMLFGVIGPVMVLFHSNFHLGSTNSSIALICMLLVAGSGLVGRYIYTHIHHGLYGARITLNELKKETENNQIELSGVYAMDETINKRLKAMEGKALQPYAGLISSLLHVIYLAVNSRQLKNKMKRLVKHVGSNDKTTPDGKVIVDVFNHYTLALRRAAAFKLYERLFSLWHILHLPLFFMMIITSIIHIFAVHMY